MTKPILEQLKNSLGVDFENLGFDEELLIFLNSVKASLVQMGIQEFNIPIDESTIYPSFANHVLDSLVKHYVALKVKQNFDPSASESISKGIVNVIIQLEGRILFENEDIDYTQNILLNPNFDNWTNDDPDDWTVTGEAGVDSEVSEVGSGEGHLGTGTGSCNIFVLASDVDTVEISQDVLSPGVRYYGKVDVSYAGLGGFFITENDNPVQYSWFTGDFQFGFEATGTKFALKTNRGGTGGPDDITFDSVELYRE